MVLIFGLFLALLVTGVLYALVDLFLWIGLLRLQKKAYHQESIQTPCVAILVAARNEEANLALCLDSLLAQQYAGDWSIWVANDRSTDSTEKILQEYQTKYPQRFQYLTITQVAAGISPKKNALTQLVEHCKADILLFTDADCVVPTQWCKTMVAQFHEGIDWVSGYSYFPTKGLLQGLQALDFLSHRTVDAAGIGWHFPITACGQNLAYRKELFKELHGFSGVDHIQSGDDDLLMHKLAQKRPQAIHYCIDPRSFVLSQGASTWQGAWEQRKRWASKTVHYPLPTLLFLSAVFLWFVLLLCSPAFAILAYGWQLPTIFVLFPLGALLWKMFWDFLVMQQGMRLFHGQGLMRWFIPMSFVQIPMIVGAVLVGTMGRFRWKP